MPFGRHQVQTVDELLERHRQPIGIEAGSLQLGCRLVEIADVFEIEHVFGVADRVRHRHPSRPESGQDVVFVTRPAILQEVLAVGRHAFDGASIARLAELATLAVLDVVAEGRRTLHAHRLQLSLRRHLSGQVALAGDQTAPTVVAESFDQVDLGLLAGLDRAVVDFVERLVDEPRRLVAA